MSTRVKHKMNRKQVSRMKKRLLDRRSRLLRGLRSQCRILRQGSLIGTSDTGDIASGAIQGFESLHLAEMQTRELKQIDGAIERIDTGTFSICEECEGPIGRARLQALPHVTLCVSCQQKLEQEGGSEEGADWDGIRDSGEGLQSDSVSSGLRLDGVAGRY